MLAPGFVTDEGNEIKLNVAQQWLWQCYQHATEEWLPSIAGNDPFVLIFNGDAIEGTVFKEQVWSVDPRDHVNAFAAVVSPLVKKAQKTFLTLGTRVHTGHTENDLAKALGAEKDPNTGRGAWDKLIIEMAGVPCAFQHHTSPTSRWYLRASALSIFLANEQVTALNHGHVAPRVLFMAHRHLHDFYSNGKSMAVTTGAWQFASRHVGKVAPIGIYRPEPTISVIDWRKRNDGELPEYHYQTYTAPEPKGVVF